MSDNKLSIGELVIEPNYESEEVRVALADRIGSLLSNPNLPESEKEKMKNNADLMFFLKNYHKNFENIKGE